jgi:hypothetical protein
MKSNKTDFFIIHFVLLWLCATFLLTRKSGFHPSGANPDFCLNALSPVPFLYGYGLFIHQKIQHPPDNPEPARIISVFT